MDQCEYEVVKSCDVKSTKYAISWKHFIRQVLIASAIWTLFFTAGLCVGTPTVLVPQLRRDNTTTIDEDMVTWLYSCFGLSAIPWVLIVPTFSKYVGRKIPYLICSASMLVVFMIQYFSVQPYQILISEVIQGFAHASNITITVLIVTEYVDPEYRGVFLTIKSASFFWGIWAANFIGTFFHWKYIAVTGILCSCYTFAGAFHPESPHWLASKGKYGKSESAFRWLHGSNVETEKELRSIIDSQTNCRKKEANLNWRSFVETLKCRQFYLPLGLALLTGIQYHFSGKMVCSFYAIDIIKKMTGDESTAYIGMLILDGVTVAGMYTGSFLSKILKRRTLYMTSSFVGVAFLLILAFYLYLVKLGLVVENNVVSILLLSMYSISISCGPLIMPMTITGEIIPIRFQAICFTIQATSFCIMMTLLVKFAPVIFYGLGIHGSFFFFGLIAGGSTVLLYFYLPETKDKTLFEIEEYFKEGMGETERRFCGRPACS